MARETAASLFAWPDSLIATHSGLRGRPGIDLTPGVIADVIAAFASTLRESGASASLGVARDGRPAGRGIAAEVARVAAGLGLDVVDFGAVSTPTAKLAARLRGLGGVVVVTASHLEADWNGVKLIASPRYLPVDIRRLEPAPPADAAASGTVTTDDGAVEEHADALCRSVDADLIRSASLRVSAAGGVGPLAEVVLERLGCRRPARGVDVGLELDADGDRLRLVDEQGTALDQEDVLPLTAIACDRWRIVKGADTSSVIDELAALHGGEVLRVPPGELHLVEGLLETGWEIAGEGNGGVVRAPVGLARDALAAAVAVLELAARSGRPLSRLAAELPRRARRRSTIACSGPGEALETLGRLAEALGVEPPRDPEEGVSIETGDGAWALVRQSATEPVLRVTVEASNGEAAEQLHRDLVDCLSARSLPA